MIRLQRLNPAVVEPIGEGLDLYIRAAGLDTNGNPVGTVELWNGTVVWSDDRVSLAASGARHRCASDAADEVPQLDKGAMRAALTKAGVALRDRLQDPAAASAPAGTAGNGVILETAPAELRRPLALVERTSYAATWPHVRTSGGADGAQTDQVLLVVRSDGQLFTDAPVEGAQPLAELPFVVHLYDVPPAERLWSGAGVRRYVAGERPAPGEVFGRVTRVVDRFIDFRRSLAPQQSMCELVATYVLASYLLDAFSVIGYLWPNADKGGGKTHFLHTLCEVAYLGQVILAGGSYASLRDLADYGAVLAFDDAEHVMDVRRADPDKRTLLLAGNRRGAFVPFKEPAGDRGWRTRYVHTFCPRAFSAIHLPDEVLASRTLVIPLVRSGDRGRANADPLDASLWPCDRRRLVDDLWALGLAYLAELPAYDHTIAERSTLQGRDLEPWRALLAVALWLEERHAVDGLFTRLEKLATDYQQDRTDLGMTDLTRLVIGGLQGLAEACRCAVNAEDAVLSETARVVFSTSQLTDRVNALAREEDLAEQEDATAGDGEFTNAKRVGWLLRRLRLDRAPRTAGHKRWEITLEELANLADAYGLTPKKIAPQSPEKRHERHERHNGTDDEVCAGDAAFACLDCGVELRGSELGVCGECERRRRGEQEA
jgi:hypothetical protein